MEQNVLIPWDQILDGEIDLKIKNDGALRKAWIVPPFSIFHTELGYWKKRRSQWEALGIESELGRGEAVTFGISPDGTSTTDEDVAWTDRGKKKIKKIDPSPGGSPMPACDYSRRERGDGRGRPLARTFGQDLLGGENPNFCQPTINDIYGRPKKAGKKKSKTGTSIFDPVLTEILYQWFVPKDGAILDPFAGGSVRGIVAAVTGRKYLGIDLSEPQLAANRIQAEKIVPDNQPVWIHGDASDVLKIAGDKRFDFIISCPPYWCLEKYSNHPSDLSNMAWEAFLESYHAIIRDCVSLLKNNRFCSFVVSNIRDEKTGFMKDLAGETIRAFEAAGTHFYNDIVLENSNGSAPCRVNQQMRCSRKVAKISQNILIFIKGCPRKAVVEIGKTPADGWPYNNKN